MALNDMLGNQELDEMILITKKVENMEIISRQNSVIQQVKKLKIKKNREASGTFIVEGYRNVIDSIKFSEPVFIFVTDGNSADFSCPVYKVTEKIFEEISDTKTPQGILGVFNIPKFDEKKVGDKIVLLNGVSDPGNVGTILRTSLATGFNTVILDKNCADAFSGKVVRSAMSAIFSLNILRVEGLDEIFSSYKDFTFYASALTDNSKSLYDINFKGKTALILGSEANGIEPCILDKADITYKIPMNKEIESLNVAVAASVSQYEIYRQNF